MDLKIKELEKFAEKFKKGFANAKLTNKEMGLTKAEYQFLWRRIDKERYKGSMAMYICRECQIHCDTILLDYRRCKELIDITENKDDYVEKYEEFFRNLLDVAYRNKDVLIYEKSRLKQEIEALPKSIVFCATVGKLQQFAQTGGAGGIGQLDSTVNQYVALLQEGDPLKIYDATPFNDPRKPTKFQQKMREIGLLM